MARQVQLEEQTYSRSGERFSIEYVRDPPLAARGHGDWREKEFVGFKDLRDGYGQRGIVDAGPQRRASAAADGPGELPGDAQRGA
jgi:hypothetical protein